MMREAGLPRDFPFATDYFFGFGFGSVICTLVSIFLSSAIGLGRAGACRVFVYGFGRFVEFGGGLPVPRLFLSAITNSFRIMQKARRLLAPGHVSVTCPSACCRNGQYRHIQAEARARACAYRDVLLQRGRVQTGRCCCCDAGSSTVCHCSWRLTPLSGLPKAPGRKMRPARKKPQGNLIRDGGCMYVSA